MYSIDGVDPKRPPRSTRHLKHKVMCGLCRFKCCLSPALEVETTEKESVELGLPRRFPIGGHCRCLGEGGCTLGERRPVLCKLAPLQVKDGKLMVSHWFVLNCPSHTDFELERVEDGKYYYRRKDTISHPRRANCQEHVVLNYPIEEFPNALKMNIAAVEELYGKEMAERYLQEVETMGAADRGLF